MTIHQLYGGNRSRKGTSWYVTSSIDGGAVLTPCVLWIIMPFPTRTIFQKNVSWLCKRSKTEVPGGLYPAVKYILHFFRLNIWLRLSGVWGNVKHLPSCLMTRCKQPYSQMCGYVKSRIVITLVCASYWCIMGFWVPSGRISMQRPQWEDGAKLNLYL